MSDCRIPEVVERKRTLPSSDDVEYLLENDVIDIDTLKQFTIPKKKSHKHDTLTRVEMNSPESRELIRIVHQSYKDRESVDSFVYSRPRIVNNLSLLDKFTERKKQMKHNGYSDKELQEVFAFLYFDDDLKAVKICSDGVQTNNTDITCLGDPKMGVYLSKHADIISPKPFKNKMFGTLLILKLIKGRVKLMSECRSGITLDPSPNFDCHLLKTSNIDLSSTSLQYIYECTQLYMYEYMEDSELSQYPGQILPYALLNFRYERIGKGLPLLLPSAPKQSRLEKKPGFHTSNSEKKASKSTAPSVVGGAKDVEPQMSSKQILIPFNEYQVWSGTLFVSELSLGFSILNSSCLLIDSSLLGSEIVVREKVSLEYFKSSVLKGVSQLDKKTENICGDVSITCATLHPSFPNANFNLFVDHLIQTETVGYIMLLDCSEIFLLPVEIMKDYGAWTCDYENHSLCCLFVSRDAMSLKIQGFVDKKMTVNLLRQETALNADKEQKSYSTFTEAPASPEPEQSSSSVNIRDPRLRFKAKSNKPDLEFNTKHNSIIGTSRLLSLFEHMSDIQDKTNIEIARRSNHGSKTNINSGMQMKQDLSSIIQQAPPKIDQKVNEFSSETSLKVSSSTKKDALNVPENILTASTPSIDSPPPKLPSFKLPETVYATAIADPKVSQLLEELKSKNIIGLGTSPHPDSSTSQTIDLSGSASASKIHQTTEVPEPRRLSKVDPRLERMSKNGNDFDARLKGKPTTIQVPETHKSDTLMRSDNPCNEEHFPPNAPVHPGHTGPYPPGDIGGFRPSAPHSPQFPDPRRRYGSFLPDPKTFQKNFMDSQHQRAPNSYSNKMDPRLSRSGFPQSHLNNR